MAKKKSLYQRWGKRFFDLVVSVPALTVLSPLMAVIAVLVRLDLGRPVIFRQKRPGLNAKPFTIYKFRTMTNERNNNGELLSEKQRITRLGKLLREASLDELPELWNVIKGDMSLVGPRPLYMEYLYFYTHKERLRHKVSPGITGLAQIKGRNAIPWNQRLLYDIEYVKKCSFFLDINIIVQTIIIVLKKKDFIKIPGTLYLPLNIERSKIDSRKK